MKAILLNLYEFSELNKDAQAAALAQFSDINVDTDWWEFTYDDFVALCATLAIMVDKKSISFRGFYSQGDGSGFNATADLLQLISAVSNQSWKDYAPDIDFGFKPIPINSRLYRLLQKGIINTNPQIYITNRKNNITAELSWDFEARDTRNYERIDEAMIALDKWFASFADKLNYHLYRSLEKEYEYLASDTAVAETIEANDNWFTIDGRKANRIHRLASAQQNDNH